MALEGTIKDFSPIEIFQTIGQNKRTGVLMLKREKGSGTEFVTVYFEEGLIVNVESFPQKIEHKLGEVLLSQGAITKQKLDRVLSIQNKTKKKMGEILIELGYVPKEKIKEALNYQAKMILIDVIQWKDGDFKFKATNLIEWDEEWFNPINVDSLLMEAMQVLDEWPIIREAIPDDSIVYKTKETGKEIKIISIDEDEKISDSVIYLTREEFEVLKLVDGNRSVKDILSKSAVPGFFVYKALYNLLRKGVIEKVEKDSISDEEIDEFFEAERKALKIRSIARIVILIIEVILLYVSVHSGFFYPVKYETKNYEMNSLKKIYTQFAEKVEKDFG